MAGVRVEGKSMSGRGCGAQVGIEQTLHQDYISELVADMSVAADIAAVT